MSSLYNFNYDERGNTLFFGADAGTFDSVNRRYPILFDIYKELKSRDWSENDIPLDNSYRDLQTAPKAKYELMTKTLTWQLEGDSLISRADAVLFAPFVTNSEYSQLLAYIMSNECLHSLTYSEIIKQCYDTPTDIFKEIENNQQIRDRSSMIIDTMDSFTRIGAMHRLNPYYDTEIIEDGIYRAAVAVYCLERISFLASFAITFALGENQFCMEIARLVQKIYIDESFHIKGRESVLNILYDLEGERWKKVFKRNRDWTIKFVQTVSDQEKYWSEYAFEDNRQIVGLNTQVLKEYVDYNTQNAYEILRIPSLDKTKQNPIPYMEDWLDIDNIQLANQETQNTNYLLNSQVDDAGDSEIDFEL